MTSLWQWATRAVAFGLTASLVCAATPAFAADDDLIVANDTGGGEVPGEELEQSPEELARLAEKLADAHEYREDQMGAYERAKRSGSRTPASRIPVPNVYLNVTHVGQVKDYYCGPTAGLMIMRYKQAGNSAYNGATLIQENMAGSDHMRTDINQSTPFANDTFRIGINRWRSGTATGFFQTKEDPTNVQFKDAFVSDIGGHSMPLGVSTIEYASGQHYNFHPNRTIGHWIVGSGFYNFAERVQFVDPAANASGLSSDWDNANEKFEGAASTFNQLYVSVAGHGITW